MPMAFYSEFVFAKGYSNGYEKSIDRNMRGELGGWGGLF